LLNGSTTVRKAVVIAENTMSKAKTVLEMTAAGLNPTNLEATVETEAILNSL